MRLRLAICLLLSAICLAAPAATITNFARIFTGGARVRSITFRSLTGNQDVDGTISVAQDGVTRGITNNFISVVMDAGAYEFQFEGSSHKNRCVVPPGDGYYSLVELTTNLTAIAYTNASRISSRVLPGTNVVFFTNNFGRYNETLTVNSSLAGGSGGTVQTNISYTAVTNEPWVEQISGVATNLTASTNAVDGTPALTVNGGLEIFGGSIPFWIHPLLDVDGDATAFFMRQNSDGVVRRTKNASILTNLNGTEIRSGTVADARIDSAIARDSEVTAAIAALSSVYQPLDSDLTTWAGITPGTGVGTALALPVDGVGSAVLSNAPVLLDASTTNFTINGSAATIHETNGVIALRTNGSVGANVVIHYNGGITNGNTSITNDLKVGGITRLTAADGALTFLGTPSQNASDIRGGTDSSGFVFRGQFNEFGVVISGSHQFTWSDDVNGYVGSSGSLMGFSSSAPGSGWFTSADVYWKRAASGVLGFNCMVAATNGIAVPPATGGTVALSSEGSYIVTSGSQTITLGSAVTNKGKLVLIKNRNVTSTTVATVSSQTIDGASTFSLPNAYSGRWFTSDGSNWLTDGDGL